MIETDRVLRPLREAEPAIEELDTYESPAALTEALRATWHAVDRTLRTLLRSDANAPDRIRMTALSPEQMTPEAIMLELRRNGFIPLPLAGRIHELRQAVARAESGGVRAADADNAREVVRHLIEEVHGLARRASDHGAGAASATGGEMPASARSADARDAPQDGEISSRAKPASEAAPDGVTQVRRRWPSAERRPLVLAGVAGLMLVAAIAAVLLFSQASEMDRGIAAFGDDRAAVAEQHFRAALQEDDANTTARLYLARILRRDGRHREAAQLLQTAVARDPDDAGVRRELGYLFLDLERPEAAAGQFRRAVEIDADDPLNWVGIVMALALSGDSTASAEWLRRAPASARSMIEAGGR